MYVCMYVCMYSIYVCMYICMYVWQVKTAYLCFGWKVNHLVIVIVIVIIIQIDIDYVKYVNICMYVCMYVCMCGSRNTAMEGATSLEDRIGCRRSYE